jgi:hypothetical protein
MSKAELDAFLTEQRTCRVATASQDGPHLTPVWYVWDGTALWAYSVVRSQRWTDISRDRRVAVLVDAGEAYGELHGAELRGGTDVMHHTGHHAWLRLEPDKITSWDFRKKASAEDYDFG